MLDALLAVAAGEAELAKLAPAASAFKASGSNAGFCCKCKGKASSCCCNKLDVVVIPMIGWPVLASAAPALPGARTDGRIIVSCGGQLAED